jgi:hypothetical protein
VNSQAGAGGSWSYSQTGNFSTGVPGFNTTAGDTLVALINTDSDGSGRVQNVSGPGNVGWTRLQNGSSSGGSTVYWCLTELWYAPNVSGGQSGSVNITINPSGNLTRFLVAEAVVNEYANVSSAPYDNSTVASGGSSPAQSGSMSTGASGSQYEVYVAGLGTGNSGGYQYLSSQSSGWNFVNSTSKNYTLSGYGAYNTIYAYDQFVTSPTTAYCQANESSDTAWSGTIIALKGSMPITSWCSNIVSYSYCSNIVSYNYCSNIVSYNYCSNVLSYGYCSNVVSTTTNWCIGSITPNYTNVANVALAGSAAPNYLLTPAGAVTVVPTNLTVTSVYNIKPYDGNVTAANTPTITGNIQPGDNIDPSWTDTETYATPDAGNHIPMIPAMLLVDDGNYGNNYTYSYVTNTGEISALLTTTLLSADVNPAGVGSNVTFTATVNVVGPIPIGNVVFSAGGTAFATNPLPLGLNTVTASANFPAASTNTIVATYPGTIDFVPSASDPLSEVVTNNIIYSQTNSIVSIINHHDGTFTLNFVGTPGAQYCVVASDSLKTHLASWVPVVGSTNTASSPSGAWSCVVSNPAPAYYRPVAVNPAP